MVSHAAPNAVSSATPVFECQDITVRYGAVVALSGVTTAFAAGQIHAVVTPDSATTAP